MRPLALAFLCSTAALTAADPALFNALEWRFIGPFRGGRVSAVTGVAGDMATFYFGSVGGGVWKTTNAGTTWSPIFDQQKIASIGAIAVDPTNPNILYVGTGETDIRSQIGFGDGVYKSTDAGKTWQNIGLRDTRQIACIRVDPSNPSTVYVAALGHVYGNNLERGVFRSTDAGRTWKNVLDLAGAVDLAFDPENSKVLYAATWNARRPPWSQYAPIEGLGSRLLKTVDGGDHWTYVSGHGLPESTWRRSGLAVTAGGRRVYFLLDAEQDAGLYRSDDFGATWTRTSSDPRLTSRGWYFSGITVDPKSPDLVYVPNVALCRSTDGGRTFTVLKGAPGGDDYRALWIDPTEPRRMILGSDQGTNISVDQGASWSTWYNQPTAQMYHVIADNQFPYAVYGSQQDSGTAAVYSRTNHGEIDARDWFTVGGAESGYIAVDPKNNNIFYVGNTSGSLARFDRRTGQSQNISPWPVRGGQTTNVSLQKYRFPWTAPLIFSASEPDTLYYGSQYLLKTVDGGLTWKKISPDLTGDTRKDKSAVPEDRLTPENAIGRGYGVIYSIGPSPLKAGQVWVGSDTGLIHLTRDGGQTWSNVTPEGLPIWSKISQIEASHFDPAEAWAAVDRHRMDDYQPYVYRTRDFGKTWTLTAAGLEAPSYVNFIREDPARKGLLYAACELGVYVSFDDGDHWQPLQLNLPVTSVRDAVVHGDDLIIATHGRGFWILDDIAPLRQIDEKPASASTILYRPATAIRMSPDGFSGTPFPVEEPKAKNPPDGAILDYYFRTPPQGEVTLEILDMKGQTIRKYSNLDRFEIAPRQPIADIWIAEPRRLTKRAGMNRFVWDLRYALPPGADDGGFGRTIAIGPQVLPGTYTVKLTAGDRSYTQALKVRLDPRSTATPLDLSKQLELSLSISRRLGQAQDAIREVSRLRRLLAERSPYADDELRVKISGLATETAHLMGVVGGGRGGGATAGPSLTTTVAELATALSVAESADRTPPATAYTIAGQAARNLVAQLAAWKTVRETKLPELNRALEQAHLTAIGLDTPVAR
jgi:photosystem II stability/assembly factor-like uncharacterized protein